MMYAQLGQQPGEDFTAPALKKEFRSVGDLVALRVDVDHGRTGMARDERQRGRGLDDPRCANHQHGIARVGQIVSAVDGFTRQQFAEPDDIRTEQVAAARATGRDFDLSREIGAGETGVPAGQALEAADAAVQLRPRRWTRQFGAARRCSA